MNDNPAKTGQPPDTADPAPETPAAVARLLKLLGGPRDGALLRHALGLEWLKAGEFTHAATAFRQATERDPQYSAAWKLLGKALFESGTPTDLAAAHAAWNQGIAVAEGRGDVQAAKEMRVFVRRLEKQLAQR